MGDLRRAGLDPAEPPDRIAAARAGTQAALSRSSGIPPAEARRLWSLASLLPYGDRPLRPLELDYQVLWESIRLEACLFLGADRNQDMKLFNGRVYFSPAPLPISQADRRVRRTAYQDLGERLAQEGRTAWDYWGPEIEQAVARLGAFDPRAADGPALADHLEEAMAVRRRHNMLHPMIWFKPRPSFFDAFKQVSGLSDPQAEAAAYRLLDGGETPFTQVMDGLFELAQSAREIPAAAALMVDPSADGLKRLDAVPEAASFIASLDSFLTRFGDRTGEGYGSETSITSPTWRERPDEVLRLAAPYLDPQVEAPQAIRRRNRQVRDQEVEAMCASCPNPQAAANFRDEFHYARRTMAVLDIHNHFIDQVGTGQLRRAIVAAAEWLAAREVIPTSEDVTWLYFTEILEALRAASPASLGVLIAHRRAAYLAWTQLDPPAILGLPEAILPARPPFQDDMAPAPSSEDHKIIGLGASPGRARGRARLVRSLESLLELAPGEILVAENAGPQWTPFFPVLGGLVLDSGSLGQHAAATAREYGIPAVVAAGTATRRIQDGAWITIDGTAGIIELDG